MSEEATEERASVKRAELSALVAPAHTALVTVELQEGVVGDGAIIPALSEAAAGILPNVAALARAARTAGVQVVHCTVESRHDGRGSSRNAPLLAAMARGSDPSEAMPGKRTATVHSSVGLDPTDLVIARIHGVSPMTGTSLDPVLRNLGVTTVVAVGVSVNVALLGFSFEAVNHGYHLVVPRDGVAGVDAAYVDAVLANTLRMLATVTTAAQLLEAWEASS